MIDKIRVKNFMSLKDVSIDLGRLTVIVGETDQGKSALVEAINAWMTNPGVEDSTRVGAKGVSVVLEMDGASVGWDKGSGVNRYYMRQGEFGEIKLFDKVGPRVPEDVVEFTKMHPVSLEKGDSFQVQIASQFDAPFLLGSGTTELAKLFSIITRIDALTAASLNVQREAKRAEDVANSNQTILDSTEIELPKAKIVEELMEKMNTALGIKTRLLASIQVYERQKQITITKKRIAESIVVLDAKIKLIMDNVPRVKDLKEALQRGKGDVEAGEKKRDLRSRVDAAAAKYESAVVVLEKARKSLEDLVRLSGSCPLCGSKITESVVDGIMAKI